MTHFSNNQCLDSSWWVTSVQAGFEVFGGGGVGLTSSAFVSNQNQITTCNSPTFWYPDADGDGFGDGNSGPVLQCVAPAGYVADSTDCCDSDPNAHPGQTALFSAPDACGSFDYNCDGILESQAPFGGCQIQPDGTCPNMAWQQSETGDPCGSIPPEGPEFCGAFPFDPPGTCRPVGGTGGVTVVCQ
jgi:hypothetical protein